MYLCSPGLKTFILLSEFTEFVLSIYCMRTITPCACKEYFVLCHKTLKSTFGLFWNLQYCLASLFWHLSHYTPPQQYTVVFFGVENMLKSISQTAVVVLCLFLQTLTEMHHTTNPPCTGINIELYLKCNSKNTAHFCWTAWIICHYGNNKTKRFKIVVSCMEPLGFCFGV